MQTIPDKYRVILAGIGLAALLWILESLIHVVVFQEGDFVRQLFSPNPFEFWMRTLTVAFIIIFSIYAQKIINRRRRAEEALNGAHVELEQIFQTAADGMRVIDKDYNVLRINKTFLDIAGISRDEASGMKCYEAFPSPLCHTASCPLTRILGGETYRECDVEKERRDGSRVPCILTVTSFRDPDGEVIAIVENLKDITERKRAEKELGAAHQRTLDIIGFLPDATVVIDSDGWVIAWNQAMEEMTGVRATEMLGKGDYEYAIPFYQERRRILADLVISYDEQTASRYPEITQDSDRLISQVFIQHLNNGKGAYLWIIASPLYNSAGKVSGAIESIRDITAQKRLERDLNTALEETKLSNADLEQFAYVASHDLQEPLRMVSSYVQLLARTYEGKLDSDADDYISFAVDGARRMQELINDLLEYSRVTARGKSFKSVNCEIIIEHVLHNMKMIIDENDAVITHDPLPTVIVDSDQIASVFQNLIGNAIKYRSKEPPAIHISARKDYRYRL